MHRVKSYVSIPTGSIKIHDAYSEISSRLTFQFQLVRLKFKVS